MSDPQNPSPNRRAEEAEALRNETIVRALISRENTIRFLGGGMIVALILLVIAVGFRGGHDHPQSPPPSAPALQGPLIGSIDLKPASEGTDAEARLLPKSTHRAETASGQEEPEGKPRMRAAISSQVKHGGLTPDQQRRADDNCLFGMPKLKTGLNIPTKFVFRDGYVLEHNSVDKIPVWVCEHITPEEARGSMERSDNFRPDPMLAPGSRSELADYKHSGYDRGHMAPAGDQNSDERLKDETFYLSNMSPQVGKLNQQVWAELEHQVREWAIDHGGAWVITAGFFYDPKEDDAATANGTVSFNTIGPNDVAVPTHFFKIVLAKDQASKVHAIGFVLENRGYPKPWKFKDYVKPIRWIEEHAGLDFMPDMERAQQDALETGPGELPGFFGNN